MGYAPEFSAGEAVLDFIQNSCAVPLGDEAMLVMPEFVRPFELEIDETVRRVRQESIRGNKGKENLIKEALAPLLKNDDAEVERIFLIIAAQTEY